MYFSLNYLSAGSVACIHYLLICPIKVFGQLLGVREREQGFCLCVNLCEESSLFLLKGIVNYPRGENWLSAPMAADTYWQ